MVKESDTTPVDGGWGNWESFSRCTRTCGGGVQYSLRECNTPMYDRQSLVIISRKDFFVLCLTV